MMKTPLIKPLQLDQFDVIREVIEQHRRIEFQKILNWYIAGFIMALLSLLWVAFSHADVSIGLFIFVLLLCIGMPSFFTWHIDHEYRRFFVAILIPEFIKRFNAQEDIELQYSLLGGIPQSTFESCGLFQHSTEYKSSGHVTGKIGKTRFQCATILAQEIRENGYGKNRRQEITIFNGLFFIADANKNFVGSTFVVPDDMEGAFGHTGHSFQELFARRRFGHCELVSMEDPEFERSFAIYSSDQIEARYLLTPLLMQQISEIRRQWNCPVHIAFIFGQIYIGIDTPRNWLGPPSVLRSVSAEVIQSTHQKVLLMLSLVDEMGLNTRIWGRS